MAKRLIHNVLLYPVDLKDKDILNSGHPLYYIDDDEVLRPALSARGRIPTIYLYVNPMSEEEQTKYSDSALIILESIVFDDGILGRTDKPKGRIRNRFGKKPKN